MTPPPASLTHVQADPAPPRPHMHQPPRHLQQAAREAARPHRDDTPGPGQSAPPDQANPPIRLSRIHRILIGVIACGAVIIAGIGFAGSYTAVRDLALRQGFGTFSYVFPIGIDAGICVLLALDLLLTFIRIPLALLRHTAWLLTAATIAFNGATALRYDIALAAGWPIATGAIEGACRHLIGDRLDITGARWGLAGAEAVLRLRTLIDNGDLDSYWHHHTRCEHQRLYPPSDQQQYGLTA